MTWFIALSRLSVDRVFVPEPSHRPPLQRNLRGNTAAVTRRLRRPLQFCPSDLIDIASMPGPTTANCEPVNVAKPRRRVVHGAEFHCGSSRPAPTEARAGRGAPSPAPPRFPPPLQIGVERNGRADKSALVSVAPYACSSVFLPLYFD